MSVQSGTENTRTPCTLRRLVATQWQRRDEPVDKSNALISLLTSRAGDFWRDFFTNHAADLKMPPKKKARASKQTVKSGDDGDSNPPAKRTPGRKRKAAPEPEKEKEEGTDSSGSPQHCHWLMKSEPESRIENGIDVKFGIEDLKALPDQTDCWDGVRNYQARNFMRQMKEGHLAFFYHSNCKEPGIAGVMKIVKEAYVDHTQFDKKDVHFDASSKPDNPKWSMVDVQYQRMLKRYLPLAELKKYHLQHRSKGGPLKDMALFTRARLSVQPLSTEEFDFVLSLEDQEPL